MKFTNTRWNFGTRAALKITSRLPLRMWMLPFACFALTSFILVEKSVERIFGIFPSTSNETEKCIKPSNATVAEYKRQEDLGNYNM